MVLGFVASSIQITKLCIIDVRVITQITPLLEAYFH